MEMDLGNPGFSSSQNLYGRWAGLASGLIKVWPPSGCAPLSGCLTASVFPAHEDWWVTLADMGKSGERTIWEEKTRVPLCPH